MKFQLCNSGDLNYNMHLYSPIDVRIILLKEAHWWDYFYFKYIVVCFITYNPAIANKLEPAIENYCLLPVCFSPNEPEQNNRVIVLTRVLC